MSTSFADVVQYEKGLRELCFPVSALSVSIVDGEERGQIKCGIGAGVYPTNLYPCSSALLSKLLCSVGGAHKWATFMSDARHYNGAPQAIKWANEKLSQAKGSRWLLVDAAGRCINVTKKKPQRVPLWRVESVMQGPQDDHIERRFESHGDGWTVTYIKSADVSVSVCGSNGAASRVWFRNGAGLHRKPATIEWLREASAFLH